MCSIVHRDTTNTTEPARVSFAFIRSKAESNQHRTENEKHCSKVQECLSVSLVRFKLTLELLFTVQAQGCKLLRLHCHSLKDRKSGHRRAHTETLVIVRPKH